MVLALLFALAVRFRARLRDGWRELRWPHISLPVALLTVGAAAIRIPLLMRPMGRRVRDYGASAVYVLDRR